MDFVGTVQALSRRWYVAVPLLLLTLAATVLVKAGVAPADTADASAMVLPPRATTTATPSGIAVQDGNPLLTTNAGTDVEAQALTLIANGSEFKQEVTGGVTLSSYSVSSAPPSPSVSRYPFITISVEAGTRREALDVTRRIVAALQESLRRQQTGTGADQQLTLKPLAPPSVVTVKTASLRAAIIALAVGLVLTALLTIGVDGLLISRSSRTPRHGASKAEDPLAPTLRGENEAEADSGSAGPTGDLEVEHVTEDTAAS